MAMAIQQKYPGGYRVRRGNAVDKFVVYDLRCSRRLPASPAIRRTAIMHSSHSRLIHPSSQLAAMGSVSPGGSPAYGMHPWTAP